MVILKYLPIYDPTVKVLMLKYLPIYDPTVKGSDAAVEPLQLYWVLLLLIYGTKVDKIILN